MSTIMFGAGCFWCSEAAFTRLKGVTKVESGYAGGEKMSPSYEEVSTGATGHAEVVRVEYDSQVIKLSDLLTVFFSIHDPTTLNRQGHDVGTEYRSAIYYQETTDKPVITRYLQQLTRDHTFSLPLVTEVKEVHDFYPADESHFRYYELNRESRYCQLVINPKIAKLRQSFAHLLK